MESIQTYVWAEMGGGSVFSGGRDGVVDGTIVLSGACLPEEESERDVKAESGYAEMASREYSYYSSTMSSTLKQEQRLTSPSNMSSNLTSSSVRPAMSVPRTEFSF